MEDCVFLYKPVSGNEATGSLLFDIHPFFKNILACFLKMKLQLINSNYSPLIA
jgi:hypothetical protein